MQVIIYTKTKNLSITELLPYGLLALQGGKKWFLERLMKHKPISSGEKVLILGWELDLGGTT